LKALASEIRTAQGQRDAVVEGLAVDEEAGVEARRVQEVVLWRRNVLEHLNDLETPGRRDALTALGVTVRVQPAWPGPGGRRKRWSIVNGIGA
jgi:hypothetical protein